MALNWKTAQKNEKKFWEDIFVNEKQDDIYSKSESASCEHSTLEIIKFL